MDLQGQGLLHLHHPPFRWQGLQAPHVHFATLLHRTTLVHFTTLLHYTTILNFFTTILLYYTTSLHYTTIASIPDTQHLHAWTVCVLEKCLSQNLIITMITSISHALTVCVYWERFYSKLYYYNDHIHFSCLDSLCILKLVLFKTLLLQWSHPFLMLGKFVFIKNCFIQSFISTMITSISHAWTVVSIEDGFSQNFIITMITSISHAWTVCVYWEGF